MIQLMIYPVDATLSEHHGVRARDVVGDTRVQVATQLHPGHAPVESHQPSTR